MTQNRSPDAVTGRADLLIEGNEVITYAGNDVSAGATDLLDLGIKLSKVLLANRLQPVRPNGHLGAGGLESADVVGQSLGALHHLELYVLEHGLPTGKGVNLMLEGLHVLCGSLTGVHPGLVANATFSHELNVRVNLSYLALDVVQGGLGPDQIIVHSVHLSVEDAQLGKLRQGRLAVRDLVQSRVQRLQIQQTPLTARVGFQDVPPMLALTVAPMTKSHGSVRSVQM